MKKDRTLAMAFACFLALVLLFSVFIIVMEAEHDCCGEGCVICAVLSACENLLHQLPAIRFAIAIAALIGSAGILAPYQRINNGCSFTLITLKVKLSN